MVFRRRTRQSRIKVGPCPFCKQEKEPDYKKPDELTQFISDRGRILSRSRSGICAKHQRRVARGVKIARYIALLPFVVKV